MRIRSGCFGLLLLMVSWVPGKAFADDYSHARIVRLSFVQGDVRFSRPGGESWEDAAANLPIREGYVLATQDGRAAVEFEHGAAAYLAENSTLEFTQLGLSNGAFITHLKLTEGTATFYAYPGEKDEFVVEAPTLSVSLGDRGSFRLDVTQDGAWVSVLKGQVQVQYGKGSEETGVEKGSMLSLLTGDAAPSIEQVPAEDDFDKWVAGREETLTTETTAALQYANSPAYVAGLADLAAYGAWVPYSGFGYCWRPFGTALGWAPFMSGMWTYDPFLGGWNWVSYEPWGWLPYHFGGWVYSPIYGWLWTPGGSGLGGPWRPMTGTWIGHPHGPIGIVPLHPLDRPGSVPLNAAAGFVIVPGAGANKEASPTLVHLLPGEKVQVVGQPPSRVVQEGLVPARAPVSPAAPGARRVFVAPQQGPGSTANAAAGARDNAAPRGRSSSIVYDPREKEFVDANTAPQGTTDASRANPGASGATVNGTVETVRPAKRNIDEGAPGSGAAANAEPAVNSEGRPVHHAREGQAPAGVTPQGPSPARAGSGASSGGQHTSGGSGGGAGSSSHGSGGGASSGHSGGGGSGGHGGGGGGSSGGGGGGSGGHGGGGGGSSGGGGGGGRSH